MSIHKFASNVIEKCLHYGTNEQRENVINEIISKDDTAHDNLLALVKDKFGNYVVQKMIEYSNQDKKLAIIKRIINSQALKKRDGFSKHVINFIEKLGFNAITGQLRQNQGNNNNVSGNNNNLGGIPTPKVIKNPNNNNLTMNNNMGGEGNLGGINFNQNNLNITPNQQ